MNLSVYYKIMPEGSTRCTSVWLYQTNPDLVAGLLVAKDKSLAKRHKISTQCGKSQCKGMGITPKCDVQTVSTL